MRKTVIAAFAVCLGLSQAAPAQTAPQRHPGRLLASNCFQCHGTDGRSVGGIERLAGKSANEIYEELVEMRNSPGEGGIMNPHARGYTDAQLRLIADYFSKQSR